MVGRGLGSDRVKGRAIEQGWDFGSRNGFTEQVTLSLCASIGFETCQLLRVFDALGRRRQATPDAPKHDALLMGAALTQAQSWLARRAEDLPKLDREFVIR